MALQPVYLIAARNLSPFLDALRHAQAPEKLGLRFIEDLGFKSTNDRLFIPLLKAMRFLDEAGKPTARYHSFLDDAESKRVLADGVRDAFSDLFRINKKAHALSRDQLTGKLKSLGEGKLTPAILANMTKTFLELVKLADFTGEPSQPTAPIPDESAEKSTGASEQVGPIPPQAPVVPQFSAGLSGTTPALVYRVEIVLPAVRDQAVYDAIFRSVREHLFR